MSQSVVSQGFEILLEIIHHSIAIFSKRSYFDPQKGDTLVGEIACYGLPYGALGFISHILTYHTIVCLSFGRKPLWPWRPLTRARRNLWLAICGKVGGLGLATFTIVRCRNHWQLLVIGIWTTCMTIFNGVTAIHISVLVKRAHGKAALRHASESSLKSIMHKHYTSDSSQISDMPTITQTRTVWWWILLYLPGMGAGMFALMTLVITGWARNWTLRIVSFVFAITLGCALLCCILWPKSSWFSSVMWVAVFSSLAGLYGDWTLGALVGNYLGVPSGDNIAVYVGYLVLKRLTMLSW